MFERVKATYVKMIPIPKFKILLGPAAAGLSDAEVERIRDLEYRFANLIFEAWLRKRNSQPEIAETSET
jgi:hypothetical protein